MSGLPGLDELGKATQGLRDGIAEGVQSVAHGAAEGLDAIGAHSWADRADSAGSWTADQLEAHISELGLDESDDPVLLLHGDVSRIRETAAHLKKFSAAFERTGQSLRRMDAHGWRGEAGDRFREKVSTHPKRWLTAADAFEDAASAMISFAHTVEWARGQAREAAARYRVAQDRTDVAREHYNAQVDAYNTDLWRHQVSLVSPGGSADPPPQKPGDFHDPGAEERAAAEHLLKTARDQRNSDGDTLAAALDRARSLAPPPPQGIERLKREFSNTVENRLIGGEHLIGGAIKAGASAVMLLRTVYPMDPYNMNHPGQYIANVTAVGTGLLHSVNHPTELVKGVVGDGWSTDRNQALGAFATNFIPVGGAAKVGASTVAHAAENTVARDAAHAAENTLARDAAHAGSTAAAHTGTPAAADAIKDMSPNAAQMYEGFGGGVDNNLTGIEHNIDAAAPDAAQGVPQGEVQHLQHTAESATGGLDNISTEIDDLHVSQPDSPAAVDHAVQEPAASSPAAVGHEPATSSQASSGQAVQEPTASSQVSSGQAVREPGPPGPVKWTAPSTKESGLLPEAGSASSSRPYRSADANKAFNDFAPRPSPAAEAAGHDLDAIGKKIDDLHVNQPHGVPEHAQGFDAHASSRTADAPDIGRSRDASSDVRDFTNGEAYEYGARHWRDFVNELTDEQFGALHGYSLNQWQDINRWLRGLDEGTPKIESAVQHMDEALMKSRIPDSVRVHRGTGIDHWLKELNINDPQLLRGRTLRDDGYFSTSLGGKPGIEDKPVWLHLEVPEGHPGIWMDHVGGERKEITANPTERELLLPRGTNFEVERVRDGIDGKVHIYGKVLQ